MSKPLVLQRPLVKAALFMGGYQYQLNSNKIIFPISVINECIEKSRGLWHLAQSEDDRELYAAAMQNVAPFHVKDIGVVLLIPRSERPTPDGRTSTYLIYRHDTHEIEAVKCPYLSKPEPAIRLIDLIHLNDNRLFNLAVRLVTLPNA